MLFVLAVLVIILFYIYFTKNHDYWSKRNVKFEKPLPFFGNHLKNVLVKRFMVDVGIELYYKYPKEKIVGYFRGSTPELIVRDPDIIKQILNSDFIHFHARGGIENPEKEPLIHNLFFMNGGEWRILRQKVSATFTTGKLKAMFPLVLKCTEKLQECAKNLLDSGEDIDGYDLMARYTMEFIGSCGFGLELDTIKAEHSDFLKEAKLFFNRSKWLTARVALEELYPEWKMLHTAKMISRKMSNTIIHIAKKVREQRGCKPSGRNDYMDILLDIESKGKIRIMSPYERNTDGTPREVELEMNVNCIAAQVFVFMLGGFESSATVTSFTLHQLAFNQDVQLKIQLEIDEILRSYGGKLSFESLGKMSLLEMAFKESLRMLPPAGLIRRVCTRRYTIPGTDVTIDPGVKILIPVQALHMDPNYFENPNQYNPGRFGPDSKKPHNFAYLPFGEGPRKCPGTRLGYMQSLAGLAALLHKFTVAPTPASRQQYTVKKTSYLVQVVDGGIPLQLIPRER